MKLVKVLGATSEIWQIWIADNSSSTGAGLTGLVFNSAGLTAYYHRDTDTTATAITLVTMTAGTFTSSGFKEIDATNMPGWYQFCPPNAVLASGAKSVALCLKGATNMAPLNIEVQLTAANVDDSVRLGLTALPNAAAEAAGGLYTRGSGAGQINQTNNGTADVRLADAVSHGGTLGSSTATLAVSRISVVSQSSNTNAITATGNGTGHGIAAASGSGATGDGINASSGASNGNGFAAAGAGTGAGMKTTGGGTGNGLQIVGGGTSGDALLTSATSGHGATFAGTGTTKHGINATGGATTSHGINAVGGGVGHGILATSGGGSTGDGIKGVSVATAGNGMNLVGNGTGNGLLSTGGAGAGGDGIEAAAGGGVAIRGGITGDITGNLSGSVGSVTGAVGSVTGAVGSVTGNVGGNVTGSIGSLAAQAKADVNAEVDSALDTAIPGSPTADSINERIKTLDDNFTATVAGRIDATISSRLASASISLSGGAVTVGTNNDKTGYRLSATGVDDVWDEAIAGHLGAGTTGEALSNANNGSPPSASDIADEVETRTIAAVTDVVNPVTLTAAYDAAKTAAQAGDDMGLTSGAINAVADQVWDETLADHLVAGSTGAGLNAAGSAGDPWATALPGAYGAGTAGNIIGNNLDAKVSDVPTAAENADKLLGRNLAGGSDGGRDVRSALRSARNRVDRPASTGTGTVFEEDDVTPAWTFDVTTDATAEAMVSVDPT